MKKEKIYRVFSHLPELTTERLTLRRMMVLDTDDMYEYACRPDVTKYLTWHPHPDREDTREYLEYLGNRYSAGMFYDWAVIYEPDCKMIGTCGFTAFNCTSDSAEVGYVLNPEYWGKGIATEALTRVLQFAFEELKLHRVEARFMEDNDASRKILERFGFTDDTRKKESIAKRGKVQKILTYSLTKEEYLGK